MNQIYDVFKAFVDPVFIVFILLIIAFVVVLRSAKKKSGALVLLLAIVLLYGFSIEPVSNYLSWNLEKDCIQERTNPEKTPVDVVVVLGGGVYDIRALGETFPRRETTARVVHGVQMFRTCKARQLVCAGKGIGQVTEAAVMARMAEDLGVPKEKIRLDEKSENTYQHAVELDKMFADKNIRIGLVTSAYHMKRSEIEFGKYFKNVTLLPAGYLYSSLSDPALIRCIPQSERLADNTLILREFIGRLWYSMKQ